MAEDGVLQLELRLAPAAGKRADETDEHEVNERSQGARMLPASVNQTGKLGFGAPQACCFALTEPVTTS